MNNTNMLSFGQLLKKYRTRSKGLTQKELAFLTDVNVRTIRFWESDLAYPELNNLKNLIEALLKKKIFIPGKELEEAKELWNIIKVIISDETIYAAYPPFDENWFSSIKQPNNYIPFFRNVLFEPRPGEFSKLENLFVKNRSTDPVRVGLVGTLGMIGMGGIGKTQLAIELAYLFEHYFPDGIFWMKATGTSYYNWQRELAELAVKSNCLPPDDDVNNPEKEVRRADYFCKYLANHKNALLILDNVEDFSLIVSSLAKIAGRELDCSIIYTSRSTNNMPGVIIHKVNLLSEESSLKIILGKPRSKLLKQSLTLEQELEYNAARNLCRLVGYLPLALVHLRSLLIDEPSLTLQSLLSILNKRSILDVVDGQDQSETTLFTTFQLGWEKLNDPNAQDLFILTSFYPEATPAPLWLLGIAAGLGESYRVFDPLGKVKKRLEQLSLLENLSEGLVRLHPLVREFAQHLVLREFDLAERLVIKAGERIVKVFEDVDYLRSVSEQNSYWETLSRIRSAIEFCLLLGAEKEVEHLQQIERWLDRESYILGASGLWPKKLPSLFYQQLYNRAVEEGQVPLNGATPLKWVRQIRSVGAENKALMKVIIGHSEDINVVLFSPLNNINMLTGSDDGSVRIWNTATGQLVTMYREENSKVLCAKYSPNGRTIVVGLNNGTVCVLDGESGVVFWSFNINDAPIRDVAFSPDGTKILIGSENKIAYLWDEKNKQEIQCFVGHNGAITSVDFSYDGTTIFTGSEDKTARIWKITSNSEPIILYGHTEAVTSGMFFPNGNKLVTGSRDYTARIWNISGMQIASLEGHSDYVESVAVSYDGTKILTGSEDKTVRIWDGNDYHTLDILEGHGGIVRSVVFSQNGTKILTGSSDKFARLWDINRLNLEGVNGKFGNKYLRKTIITADGTSKSSGYIRSVSFSSKGEEFLTGAWDYNALLWRVGHKKPIIQFKGHEGYVRCVAFSFNDELVLTGSEDHTARLWDAKSGKELKSYIGHEDILTSVAFSNNNELVLTGSNDCSAIIWSSETGNPLYHLRGHSDWVKIVIFSPDNKHILTGSSDKTAKLWDVRTGTLIITFEGHKEAITSLSFSPNGKFALTGSSDKTAKLWDVRTGTLIITLKDHNDRIRLLSISPDNKFIITCDRSGQMKIWYFNNVNDCELIAFYSTPFEIRAIHWINSTDLILADDGGPNYQPHLYNISLDFF